MDELLINEAERITDCIIKTKHHNLNLIDLIDKYINTIYLDHAIKIHACIPILLARKDYMIVNTDPLVIKKIKY